MGAEAVRVLVVDDSPVDRRVVELLLRAHCGGGGAGGEAAPFHVTAVDSGKKAMELLGRRRGDRDHLTPSSPAAAAANDQAIDIVLTDYCMPEMTGYDLLKAIKALGSPNPIPVVVMSSENEPQRISSPPPLSPPSPETMTVNLRVMNASSFEVSHYFQLIFKLILLAYAVLCLSQLLHRWSNGSSLLSLWCA
uniref:Response regulatory domain-containing protein n=1 Tax=Oryza meridionalis TaxID=40149 RepID=A0A0E0CM14_9ORYZ